MNASEGTGPPDGLNDNHKRRLLATFAHIDNLLAEAWQALAAEEEPSPFRRYRPDLPPEQRPAIGKRLLRLRAAMVRVLADRGIAIPPPPIGVRRYLESALRFAKIDVEELGPESMRGYGPLSAAAAGDLRQVTAQIAEELDDLLRCLDPGGAAGGNGT